MEQTKKNMELLAKFVIVEVKHDFTHEERLQKSEQIARLLSDIDNEEQAKKQRASEFKNKIDTLKAEAKLISGHITNGYAFIDKNAELYLDYKTNERVYLDKQDGTELKRESFHASDFQKKIQFEGLQDEINDRNDIGDYAEGDNGTTSLKPTPKGNLPDNYGANFEQEEDNVNEDGLFRDSLGNLTDIHPAQLKEELENGPGASELEKVIKEKVDAYKKSKKKS